MSTHSNGLPSGMVGGMNQKIWDNMNDHERNKYKQGVEAIRATPGQPDIDVNNLRAC